MIKKIALMIIVVAIVFAFSLPAEAEEDTLIIASPAEAVSLDPRLENDVYSQERIHTITQPLVKYDTEINIKPRLAKDWEFSDDGQTLTFYLHEGVTFHDGERFTAEDVKYTYEWVLDPDNDSPNRELYTDIEEMEIEDDYTIHFHLERENPFLLNNLARIPVVPAHHGDREDFSTNPVGTGPYEFVSWDRDDVMRLEAYEDYWEGEPNFKHVEFRPIEEDSARQMAVEAGDVDAFQGEVVPEEIESLREDPNVNIQTTTGSGHTYMAYNTRKDPLDDVNIRRAISHLVPKEAIVDRILHGLGTPAPTPIPEGTPWHNPDVPTYDYNPEKAAELIEEAGYDIEELSLSLTTNEDDTRIRIAEIIQAEAAQIGLDIDVSIEEWGAFWSTVRELEHDYELFIIGWVGLIDPDRAMYRQFHTDGVMNFGAFSHARLDELLEKGRTVPPDSQESMDIYGEAQEIVAENQFYTTIYYYEEVGVSVPELEGFEPHPYVSMVWQHIDQFSK